MGYSMEEILMGDDNSSCSEECDSDAAVRSNPSQQQQQQRGGTTARGAASAGKSESNGAKKDVMSDRDCEIRRQKERFLMFTRVLMKYLETKDPALHKQVKGIIKDCAERNKRQERGYESVTASMRERLKQVVGECYWKRAESYLNHFLNQKKKTRKNEDSTNPNAAGAGTAVASAKPASTKGVSRDFDVSPGTLGIKIEKTKHGLSVAEVRDDSSLKGKVFPGDLIRSVDDVDTRAFTGEQFKALLTKKSLTMKITVLSKKTTQLPLPLQEAAAAPQASTTSTGQADSGSHSYTKKRAASEVITPGEDPALKKKRRVDICNATTKNATRTTPAASSGVARAQKNKPRIKFEQFSSDAYSDAEAEAEANADREKQQPSMVDRKPCARTPSAAVTGSENQAQQQITTGNATTTIDPMDIPTYRIAKNFGITLPKNWPPGLIFTGNKSVSSWPSVHELESWYLLNCNDDDADDDVDANDMVEIRTRNAHSTNELACFAAKEIAKGAMIGIYTGHLCQHHQSPNSSSFDNIQGRRNNFTLKYDKDGMEHMIDGEWVIDAEYGGNELRFIHDIGEDGLSSETANVRARSAFQKGRPVIIVEALVPIGKDDVLLWDGGNQGAGNSGATDSTAGAR